MYGTVMIGKLKGGQADAMRAAGERWMAEMAPKVAGFRDEWVMAGDDGTCVMAVRFDSKDAYMKLADDPAQDAFYQEVFAPLLDGDPQWIDGEWVDEYHA